MVNFNLIYPFSLFFFLICLFLSIVTHMHIFTYEMNLNNTITYLVAEGASCLGKYHHFVLIYQVLYDRL